MIELVKCLSNQWVTYKYICDMKNSADVIKMLPLKLYDLQCMGDQNVPKETL